MDRNKDIALADGSRDLKRQRTWQADDLQHVDVAIGLRDLNEIHFGTMWGRCFELNGFWQTLPVGVCDVLAKFCRSTARGDIEMSIEEHVH